MLAVQGAHGRVLDLVHQSKDLVELRNKNSVNGGEGMRGDYQASFVAVLCLFLLIPPGKGYIGQTESTRDAEVDINSVVPLERTIPSATPHSPKMKIRNTFVTITPVETIPLDFLTRGEYLSTIRLDLDGNIYLKSYAPPDQTLLFKFNPNRREHQRIVPELEGTDTMRDFVIGEEGKVYISVSSAPRRGAIVILSPDGSLMSRIQTGSFLISKFSIDAIGRIWAAGQLFEGAREGAPLRDVQLRVYDQNGQMISVPVGGLDIGDSELSLLVMDDNTVKFISHAKSAVFDFADTKLIAGYVYPFRNVTDIRQSKVKARSPRQRRLTTSIAEVGGKKIWCGYIESGQDTYPKSFIGITNSMGEALTPEIMLPVEYGALAGVDNQGNLYAYAIIKDHIVLKKFKIEIRGKGVAIPGS